jgi:cbb3-type cytochrome oxidase cytochrome c subunit
VLGRSALGPDLARAVSERPPEWLLAHFEVPGEETSPSTLSGAQRQSLVKLVTKWDERTLNAWLDPPMKEIQGAMLYQARGCAFCHTLNGAGAKNGPVLNGLAGRRSREWVEGHFGNPQAFAPGSQMPAYRFTDEELDQITSYLMAVPK